MTEEVKTENIEKDILDEEEDIKKRVQHEKDIDKKNIPTDDDDDDIEEDYESDKEECIDDSIFSNDTLVEEDVETVNLEESEKNE